jgi:DNA-directed RNA polymerase alpha subunit
MKDEFEYRLQANRKVAKELWDKVSTRNWYANRKLSLWKYLPELRAPEEYKGPKRLGVWEVHIGNRAQKHLFNNGFFFLGDLIQCTWDEIFGYFSIGYSSMNEITYMLKDYGLELKKEEE